MNRTGACLSIPATMALACSLAACVPAPPREAPPPAPVPVAVTPPPVALPARPWQERALDAGGWRYEAASRSAAFVSPGNAGALLTMACSNGLIRMTSTLGTPGQVEDVELKTSAGLDRLRFDGTGAILPGNDPKLDRIAFSRGRFALEAANGQTLTLPVQSEIGRVIEDCRR